MFALIVAACGGSDPGGSNTPAASTTAPTAAVVPTAAERPAGEPETIAGSLGPCELLTAAEVSQVTRLDAGEGYEEGPVSCLYDLGVDAESEDEDEDF